MIGLRAQAGLLFVEADSEFTFSGDPISDFLSCRLRPSGWYQSLGTVTFRKDVAG